MLNQELQIAAKKTPDNLNSTKKRKSEFNLSKRHPLTWWDMT